MIDEFDVDTIPVYACASDELNAASRPIGRATNAGEAARMMRKFLAERDGDDYGLRARDVYYSRRANAYFTEE